MNPVLHRGKLLVVTVALACGGLAASAAIQAAQAATQPAAATSAHIQPGSPYEPPNPC